MNPPPMIRIPLFVLFIAFHLHSNDLLGQDWPGFLGPQGDGKSSASGIRKDWSAGQLPVLWTRPVQEPYCIGSVSNGKYFHFDRDGDEAVLTCLDAASGDEYWSFRYPTQYVDSYGFDGGPRSSPVVDEERVYVFGVEGMLHCLNVDDGSTIWSVDTAREFGVVQNFFGVGSTPVVFQDLLLVMVGGSPEESQSVMRGELNRVRPNGSAMVAFDKKTGKVVYQVGDDLASYASPIIRELGDQTWCLAFCREQLIGFRPESGELGFQFPWRAKKLESVNASSPVTLNNQIFLTESYGPGGVLLEWAQEELKVVWQDQGRDNSLQSHWATPIGTDGFLYGCHGQYRGTAELRCIDAKTGNIAWSEPGLQRSSLTYVDGHFICLSEGGGLRLLRVNPERYELITQFEATPAQVDAGAVLKYPCWSAPIIADGKLYVQGKDRLVCFELIP